MAPLSTLADRKSACRLRQDVAKEAAKRAASKGRRFLSILDEPAGAHSCALPRRAGRLTRRIHLASLGSVRLNAARISTSFRRAGAVRMTACRSRTGCPESFCQLDIRVQSKAPRGCLRADRRSACTPTPGWREKACFQRTFEGRGCYEGKFCGGLYQKMDSLAGYLVRAEGASATDRRSVVPSLTWMSKRRRRPSSHRRASCPAKG